MFPRNTVIVFIIIFLGGLFFALNGIKQYKNYQNSNKQYKVVILQFTDHPALNKTRQGIVETLKNHNISIIQESANNDMNIAKQIITKFIHKKVDVFITLGTLITQLTAQQNKNIPIVISSVTDPVISGILKNISEPEGNVTGVSNFYDNITVEQLKFFQALMPSIKTLGIIYNSGEINSVHLLNDVKRVAKISIKEIPIDNTNDIIMNLSASIKNVDAIFINNDNTAFSGLNAITDISQLNNKPVFSSDIDTIEAGVTAAVGPDQFIIGQMTANIVIDILQSGKNIKDIPVQFPTDLIYLVNKQQSNYFHLNTDIPSIKYFE
jgi:putative ABC transport system substrate-binding protein